MMKIISTVFSHYVYSGLHDFFKDVAQELDVPLIECDDVEHGTVMIRNTGYIINFNYSKNGRKIDIMGDDIVLTRSLLSTSQPFFLRFSGNRFFVVEEYAGDGKRKSRVYETAAKSFLKNVAFVPQVPRVERFLKGMGMRTFFLPPFMKPEFISKKGEHILYVARMAAVKKPEFVIELAKEMPEEEFVIVTNVGNPSNIPMRDKIKAEAEKLPNVRFLEKISYGELMRLQGEAKALLLPTMADPIGYTVIEALSRGTPAITTTYAGASDFLPKGWVLDNFDLGSWKEIVRKIVSDLKSREKAKNCFLEGKLEIGGPYYRHMVGEVASYIKNQKAR